MSPLNHPDIFFLSSVLAVQEITVGAAAKAVPECIPRKYVQDFLNAPFADTVEARICDLFLRSPYFLSQTDKGELLVRRQNKKSSNMNILITIHAPLEKVYIFGTITQNSVILLLFIPNL